MALHLYCMSRIFIIIGSFLFLLLFSVSLFLPYEIIRETFEIKTSSNNAQNFSYYLESHIYGKQMILPIINLIILFLTVVFIIYRKGSPLYALISGFTNLILIIFIYYTVMYSNHIQDPELVITVGNGLYSAIAANLGILVVSMANYMLRNEAVFKEDVLDSI